MADEGDTPLDQTPEEQQVQERRLLESLDREGELTQLKSLLTQEAARDVMWRILSYCKVYSSVFDTNCSRMSLAEGKRQVGLWLLSEICEADPSAEMLIRQKANQLDHDEKRRERERRQRRRT